MTGPRKKDNKATKQRSKKIGVPKGIRTPVAAVKGQCPRPLDDGDLSHFSAWHYAGGAKRTRTADLLRAMQALSQLSYSPNAESAYITYQKAASQSLSVKK